MNERRLLLGYVLAAMLVVAGAGVAGAGCGSSTGVGATMDAGPGCGANGTHCSGDTDCCTGRCDPKASTCLAGAPVNCGSAKAACATSLDCCSLACVNGACAAAACQSDGLQCTSDAGCCSGTCANGTCTPLNTSCKTAGNACAQSSECCSKLCQGGHCSIASSFCIQSGDACTQGPDCCGGVCTVATGKTVGTCSAPPPGATYCNGGTDGTVCSGCGDCCSRLCAPYGPYAVKVCQPANGCHVNGDLCTRNEDCCGAAGTGLPGAGNVTCEIQSGLSVGICRNPTGLNPECNICHYTNYACSISSARNDCASAVGNSGVCKLDALGVPRCFGGGACASSGAACACDFDCCDGGHCVPGANGRLVCQPGCSASAGACTVDANCCSGLHCYVPQGSTNGSCGGPPPPPAGVDAGLVAKPEDGGALCAAWGQACTQSADCCNGVGCNAPGGTAPCTTGQTGCTCFNAIQ